MVLSSPPPPTGIRRTGNQRRLHRAQVRRRRLGAVVLLAVICLVGVKLATRGVKASPSGPGASGNGQGTPLDPRLFATGACMAYPPTSGNRHLTVFLDAGHGGPDPGALGTTESGQSVTEASLTLPMELDTMALLRAAGYRVVESRTSDTTVLRLGPGDESGGILTELGAHGDVAARAQCADDASAAVLVGIYMDAGASSQDAGSLTAYDTARPFAAQNEKLAEDVGNDVLDDMNANGWQIPDIGPVTDDTVGSVSGDPYAGGLAAEAAAYDHLMLLGPAEAGFFSTPTTMPGTILEPLFITDPFEASIADSATGQETVARGIAQAVEQFLSPTSSSTSTSTSAA